MRATTVGLVAVLFAVVGGCSRPDPSKDLLVRGTVPAARAESPFVGDRSSGGANRSSALAIRLPASAVRRVQVRHWNETVLVNAMVAEAAVEEARTPPNSEVVVSAPAESDVWSCIATAETGGVPAPGPTYWTVFGVVRDVIEDYGTPDEQAAIFGMSADYATQLAPVARFAGENGFGGWGELTKRKCGL